MEKSLLFKLAILFLATAMLSGCILVPRGIGLHHKGGHSNGHNGHGGHK